MCTFPFGVKQILETRGVSDNMHVWSIHYVIYVVFRMLTL